MSRFYKIFLMTLVLFAGVSSVASAGNRPDRVVVNKKAPGSIIGEAPAGTLKTYDRAGYAWYVAGTGYRKGLQTGTVDFVFTEDNKVYIKQPLSKLEVPSWVEGTLSEDGKTITVQLGQYLGTNEDATDYVALHIMEFDEDYEEYTVVNNIHEITYTIADDGTIKLNGTSEQYALGASWVSDGEWSGYCDYASVYTLGEANSLVTPPANLTTETYEFKASAYIAAADVNYPVQMGFDGNDVYLKGFFTDLPNAWIKGTKSGDKITFASQQYLGQQYKKDYFFLATTLSDTHTLTPLELKYNASTGAYENTTNYAICSGSKTQVYLTEALSNLSLKKIASDGIVFDVPFLDGFDSQSSMANYTIIDANGDGAKWRYNGLSQLVSLDWGAKDHDDWLITPAIRLEAGKNYKFALKARCFASTYPETFSVSAGKSATVEGMTTSVIAESTAKTGDMTEFSGIFTADADGEYYFGVHATTASATQFAISIDDISVVETEATGIGNVVRKVSNNDIYTIQGTKVDNASKPGIYVIGGKKVIVR